MRLGVAIQLLKGAGGRVDLAAIEAMALSCEAEGKQMQAAGRIGEAKRLARRADALNRFIVHGPHPERLVAETELPESYWGKILMVLISGGGFDHAVCLRSGDEWHREILRNTRAEIADLGFPDAQVHPLGGAYAGFDSDGRVLIWGASDEYGCCDKDQAASLIVRAYPGRAVTIED